MCVGVTKKSIHVRLSNHVAHALRRRQNLVPSQKWILELLAAGVRPKIRLLATTDDRNWRPCEKRFITIWRRKNPQLLNVLDGGNGPDRGSPKLICEKHGTKRRRYAGGQRKCRECEREYQNTPEYRAYLSGYRKRSTRLRAYRRSPKARRYMRQYLRAPKWKRYMRNWARMSRAAKKLGLTVAQYREKLAR